MAIVRIGKEEDTSATQALLYTTMALLIALGSFLEYSGIDGAVVASTGVVVAVTTPIFASALGQLADYSASVRHQLFHYRVERKLGQEVGNIAFSSEGRSEFDDAIVKTNALISDFEEHELSLRRGTARLVRAQSCVIAMTALAASFASFAENLLTCGATTC